MTVVGEVRPQAEPGLLRYCAVCRRVVEEGFAPGPGGRPDASCPHCGSLERHRYLACVLGCVQPLLPDAPLVLEVAPSQQTTPVLRRLQPRRLVALDFDPSADRRKVDVQASLTELPFPDGSVDLLVCFHVLEHVPEDRKAIEEICRVLTGHGLGILQVPWRPGTTTDEDPDAEPAERLRRFGQVDHVRYYGGDLEDRLREGGLAVRRLEAGGLLGQRLCDWMGVPYTNPIWLVHRADRDEVPAALVRPNDLAQTFDAVLAQAAHAQSALKDVSEQLALATGELERARHRVRVLRRRVRRLSQREPEPVAPTLPGRLAKALRDRRRPSR